MKDPVRGSVPKGNNEVVMQPKETPSDGHADVRIVAASPEDARRK
ncbi:hypothetical protein [Streptomyces sp. GESEQ-4]|nr:hypothetical protein [Streptomyces sp. GESEQ-4]